MTKKERTTLKTAISERQNQLEIAIKTFGANSNEAWIIENELRLLENLFPKPLKNPVKSRKTRKDKGKRRVSNNNQKLMYINSEGDLFIQIRENGEFKKIVGNLTCVSMFNYIAYGILTRYTETGIVLTNWRLEQK